MTTSDPKEFRDINHGGRLLMGPVSSEDPALVLQTMAAPCIGRLDPYFLTIPVSATGSAGMETCLVNLVESGDEVVVSVNGGYIL